MTFHRPALRRASCLITAALLALTLGTVGPTSRGIALGPVTAITPFEVAPFTAPPIAVINPSLSGRGEVAGAYDMHSTDDAFAFLDTPGQDPMFDGLGVAVSGDGCAAVYVAPPPIIIGIVAQVPTYELRLRRRCPAFDDYQILTFQGFYDGSNGLALSHDGRFAVVVLPQTGNQPSMVARVDTNTGAVAVMPAHGAPYFGWDATLGVDISDDGNVVVAVEAGTANSTAAAYFRDVVAWDVPSNTINFVSGPAPQLGGAGFPSVSGDGRFVSFTSAKPLGFASRSPGPWVYVADRANGQIRLVSALADFSYNTSITRDGSQVAYAVGIPGTCKYDRLTLTNIMNTCPAGRIDVAYGPVPGLVPPISIETISILANGAQGGNHWQPALSGNGQFVAWISNAAAALLGSTDPALNGTQAVVRRRDPALAVDPIDFGTIAANSSSTLGTTIRNTGHTSISLDSITVSPGRFTIQGGGSCVGGSLLPPGATCTVNVRFAAPNNASDTPGQITVSESGFFAVSASNSLIGRSSFTPPPVTTTTTTTTTTTVVGQRPTPTTTTTTTTTTPTQIALNADPNPVDYGQVAVGIGSPIKTVTITNIGTGPGQLLTELGGDNPEDFYVARNGCDAVTLAPNESCSMDIMMIPLAGGIRKAELILTAGGVSGSVDLFGDGHFAPQLVASPSAITTSGITSIVGHGFPPNQSFSVRVVGADQLPPINVTLPAVTSDATGTFRILYSALGKLQLGDYALEVDPVPNVFDAVHGQLVVVLPTFQPLGPGGPAFSDSLLVTRGSG